MLEFMIIKRLDHTERAGKAFENVHYLSVDMGSENDSRQIYPFNLIEESISERVTCYDEAEFMVVRLFWQRINALDNLRFISFKLKDCRAYLGKNVLVNNQDFFHRSGNAPPPQSHRATEKAYGLNTYLRNIVRLYSCHSRLSGIFPKNKKDCGQAAMTQNVENLILLPIIFLHRKNPV
jgi:hypothetical protein